MLVEKLKASGPKARSAAAWALSRIGANAEAAVPALIAALRDEDREVRASSALALGRIGGAPEASVAALAAALGDKHPMVRMMAAESLGKFEAVSAPAVPALTEALTDPNQDVRLFAARALGEIGPSAKTGMRALLLAFENKRDPLLRSIAGVALFKLGREDATIADLIGDFQNITRCLDSSDALTEIGAPGVPALIEAMKDANETIRARAVATLGSLGPAAKGAVPHLIAALRDRSHRMRSHAAEALGRIGAQAEAAVPDLISSLGDKEASVREYAARALGRMGPTAKPAIPVLEKLLQSKVDRVRANAAWALAQIRGHPASAPASRPAFRYTGARASGKYYLVIERLKGRTKKDILEARRIVMFLRANGHLAEIRGMGPRWVIWSLKGFKSPREQAAIRYARMIQDQLGKAYFTKYRTYRFLQSDKAGKLSPTYIRQP